MKAARISTFIILALSILKGFIAIISGSIALLADSIHSFVDIFSSVAVWAGLKLIQREPTERFPYGYYRAESLALLIVSTVIILSGTLILIESIEKLFQPIIIQYSSIVLIVAAFSGATSFFLGKYKQRVGKRIGSQSLVSEGKHSTTDVYASLVVFIGVFFYYIGFPQGEVLAGVVIGILILKIGYPFGRDAILALMDASPDPQAVQKMKDIAESLPDVEEVHHVRLRRAGPVYFGEMHVILRKGVSIERSHEVSEHIEERVKEQIENMESLTIHIAPFHEEKHSI